MRTYYVALAGLILSIKPRLAIDSWRFMRMGTLSLSSAGIISVCHHAELTCFVFFYLGGWWCAYMCECMYVCTWVCIHVFLYMKTGVRG